MTCTIRTSLIEAGSFQRTVQTSLETMCLCTGLGYSEPCVMRVYVITDTEAYRMHCDRQNTCARLLLGK